MLYLNITICLGSAENMYVPDLSLSIVVTCPSLGALVNGHILITPPVGSSINDYGSVASHSCDRGYYLDGNQLRNCVGGGAAGTTGFWDGAPPTCRC